MKLITLKIGYIGMGEGHKVTIRADLFKAYNHDTKVISFEDVGEYFLHEDSLEWFERFYKI